VRYYYQQEDDDDFGNDDYYSYQPSYASSDGYGGCE